MKCHSKLGLKEINSDMYAVVKKVNLRNEFVVFKVENSDYGWMQILDGHELEKDDIIIGNFERTGKQMILKKQSNEKIEVCIEDFGMSYNAVINIVK